MDASTVYTLIIKLASSGGTVYALAALGACLLLTAILGAKIYRETKNDKAKNDAKTELEVASKSGDANRLRRAIERLRDVSK